jgi:hypothetical protein
MAMLVYKQADGGVRIVIPVLQGDLDEMRAHFEDRDPSLKECEFVGTTDKLPSEDGFRECWRHDGKKIFVDPELKKAARWKQVRGQRDALLKESDSLIVRAMESNKDVDAWKSYRDKLRQLPETNGDPDKVAWPDAPGKVAAPK